MEFPPSPSKDITSPSKHHSKEADELDFLCRKLSDVRVRHRPGVDEEDLRLSDVSAEQFKELVRLIASKDKETLRSTVIKFRKLLAHEDIHPYLQKIVDAGVVPNFVGLLSHCVPELQFEAAWILTNIAAGSTLQTKAVVESEGLPALIHLLSSSPYKEIREQCVWCLGNIAGDSADMRETLLNYGALDELLSLITIEMNEFLASENFSSEIVTKFPASPRKTHNYNLSTLRIAIWALSNICRGNGKTQLDWNLIDVAMPILSQVITCCCPGSQHADDEIVMDACWALSRTLRGIHEGIKKVIVNMDVCKKLGSLICYDNPAIQLPALRCLINIVSGCDAQTQIVVDADILPCLHALLRNPHNETVQKEACLIISNITAGTKSQVQAVIEAHIIPTLVEILQYGDFKTKREACWAIGNATLNKDYGQIEYLVSTGFLPPMISLISPVVIRSDIHDERISLKILETIKNILTTDTSIPSDRVENLLLAKFNSMTIASQQQQRGGGGSDSAYTSMTNLFDNNNLFHQHFTSPIADGRSAVDFMKHLQTSRNDELSLLSEQILNTWFQ